MILVLNTNDFGGVNIIYLLFFSVISLSLFIKKSKHTLKVYFLFLLALLTFRYGIGTDYFSYELIYSKIQNNPINELLYGTGREEVLFRFILSFFKLFNIPFQGVIFFSSVLFIVYSYKIIYEFSSYKFESLLVLYSMFYFVWGMSGIRQGLSMMIGGYYLLLYFKDDICVVKLIVVVFILFLVHRSSIVLLIMGLFGNNLSKRNNIYILLFLSFAFSLFKFNPLIKLIINLDIIDKTSFNYTGLGFGLDKKTLFRLPFLFLVLYTKPKNPFFRKQKKAIIISFTIYFVLKSSELIAARFLVYGWLLFVIYLPQQLYEMNLGINNNIRKILFISVMFLLYLNQTNVVYSQIEYYSASTGLENNQKTYISIFNKNNYTFAKKNKYEGLQK